VPKIAKIWDFIALDSENFSILESEIERAKAFFTDAINDSGLLRVDTLRRTLSAEEINE
jgi:hypothetical protein